MLRNTRYAFLILSLNILFAFVNSGCLSRVYYHQLPRGEYYDMPRSDAYVTSEPAGARIFIDGRQIDGLTPLKIAFGKANESYTVEVEKDGFFRESAMVHRVYLGFFNSIAHNSCDPNTGCLYMPFLPCQVFGDEKQFIFEPYRLHFVLRPKGQGLELYFERGEMFKEAEVWIDDEMRGFAGEDGVFFGLAEGDYRLVLKLFDGTKWEGKFTVSKMAHTVMHFKTESGNIKLKAE